MMISSEIAQRPPLVAAPPTRHDAQLNPHEEHPDPPAGANRKRTQWASEGEDEDREEGVDSEEPPQRKRVARTRQNFCWRQISVLEQVFELGPLPCQVRATRAPRPASSTPTSLCSAVAPRHPPVPSEPHSLWLRRSSASSSRPNSTSALAASKSGSRTGGRSGRRSFSHLARSRPS